MSNTNGSIKRTRPPASNEGDISSLLQILSAVTSRRRLAGGLGISHGGKRDIYETLGYAKEVSSEDLLEQWKRQDIARSIVDRPANKTWQGNVFITEPEQEDESELEKAYKVLDEDLSLKDKFNRVDKLAQLGRYAVLLLGFDDSAKETWGQPVTEGERQLRYVKPFSEKSAEIKTWEKDPSNARFGLPRLYKIKIKNPDVDGGTTDLTVHHSRIIHIALNKLEDEVYGEPIMKTAYNRLKDIEKLVGGSAEMFWRGARPGYSGSAKEDYKLGDDVEDKLKKQLDEYEHDLRRFIVAEGIDLESLAQQIADPKNHVDVQIMMLSALTEIPSRILVGSERGELASSQDEVNWKEYLQSRREEQAEPAIMRPFVERMLEYGILPQPKDEVLGYSVEWPSLFTLDEKERAEVGEKQAKALTEYTKDPNAEWHVPLEAFLKYFLNMDEDTVKQIEEMKEARQEEMIAEEDEANEDAQRIAEEEAEAQEQEQEEPEPQ